MPFIAYYKGHFELVYHDPTDRGWKFYPSIDKIQLLRTTKDNIVSAKIRAQVIKEFLNYVKKVEPDLLKQFCCCEKEFWQEKK